MHFRPIGGHVLAAALIPAAFVPPSMHRLPDPSSVRRFRFAAFLHLLRTLLMFAAFAVLAYSLFFADHHLTIAAIILGAGTLAALLLQWMVSNRTRCPLCMTPVLAYKECAKHRRARRLFGSYRLRVVMTILFRDRFICPYCNEPTAMESRRRRD